MAKRRIKEGSSEKAQSLIKEWIKDGVIPSSYGEISTEGVGVVARMLTDRGIMFENGDPADVAWARDALCSYFKHGVKYGGKRVNKARTKKRRKSKSSKSSLKIDKIIEHAKALIGVDSEDFEVIKKVSEMIRDYGEETIPIFKGSVTTLRKTVDESIDYIAKSSPSKPKTKKSKEAKGSDVSKKTPYYQDEGRFISTEAFVDMLMDSGEISDLIHSHHSKISIGRSLAKSYREKTGREPEKIDKHINGDYRSVNAYHTVADRDLVINTLRSLLPVSYGIQRDLDSLEVDTQTI